MSDVTDRLDYLRGEIEAERISYGEIAELQNLGTQGLIPEDDVLRPYRTKSIICFDDIGRVRPTDFFVEKLEMLVEVRYLDQCPTIWTTKFNPDHLAKKLRYKDDPDTGGNSIVDRIYEGSTRVFIEGPSGRVK